MPRPPARNYVFFVFLSIIYIFFLLCRAEAQAPALQHDHVHGTRDALPLAPGRAVALVGVGLKVGVRVGLKVRVRVRVGLRVRARVGVRVRVRVR